MVGVMSQIKNNKKVQTTVCTYILAIKLRWQYDVHHEELVCIVSSRHIAWMIELACLLVIQ